MPLPPLPEPDCDIHGGATGWQVIARAHSADQLRAYGEACAAAARAQALDDAIAACQAEQLEEPQPTEGEVSYVQAVGDCVAAIRAMKDKP